MQEASAASSYTAPSDGVITAWSYQSGTHGGGVKLKIFRPTGTAGIFLTVAESQQTVPANRLNSLATRIPVKAGDVLGLTVLNAKMDCEAPGATASDVFWNNGVTGIDPSPGTTETFGNGPSAGHRIDMAATLEPDVFCNTDPATPGPCRSPGSLTFAAQTVGTQSAPQTVTLSNTSPYTALAISAVTASGDFVVTANTCGASIPAQASCGVGVAFQPTATGSRAGTWRSPTPPTEVLTRSR